MVNQEDEEQIVYLLSIFLKSALKIAISEGKREDMNSRYLESIRVRNIVQEVESEIEDINVDVEYLRTTLNILKMYGLIVLENENITMAIVDNLETMDFKKGIEDFKTESVQLRKRLMRAIYFYGKMKALNVLNEAEKEVKMEEEQKLAMYQNIFNRIMNEEIEEIIGYGEIKEESIDELKEMFVKEYKKTKV